MLHQHKARGERRMNRTMESAKPQSFFLRSTTAVSLNERFSQVLMAQLTQSRTVTFDPILLQQRGGGDNSQVVLLKRELPSSVHLQKHASSVRVRPRVRRRRSIWSRLGWRQVTRRLSTTPRGFWSFRNKYRQRGGFTSTCRGGGNLCGRLGQCRFLMKRNVQKLTAEQTQLSMDLRRGRATTFRGRGWNRKGAMPTRKQLDDQLDEYMSLSKRRLDAQLDEYMAMAGQTVLTWD
uniref:chromatin target of PRMT1 protein-like n=1 Tax=Semicossyphus pulcher TaxID=241346 RepID=UPI0037E75AD9